MIGPSLILLINVSFINNWYYNLIWSAEIVYYALPGHLTNFCLCSSRGKFLDCLLQFVIILALLHFGS